MKIIKLLFLFITISSFSQTKVGTIDVDYILSKMPELTAAQQEVEVYGKGLEADLTKKYEVYNALIEAYKSGEATFTAVSKQEKQKEITESESDITKFQQNGSQLISLKRDDVLRPLYSKIGVALEKVSKTEAYTQVFQTDNSIVYIDPNYDLTLKVLKELGIEVKEGE
jgi:outer membrane protein